MAVAPDKRESELTFGEKLNDFMQKNRKILIIGFSAIVLVLAVYAIGSLVRDKIQANAFTRLDELVQRYDELSVYIGSDDPASIDRHIELFVLLEDLASFGSRSSGFPAARAYALRAEILWDMENFADAEQSWLTAAGFAGRSYFAPISFYNAAVAAEEQGNIETAISHYRSAITYGDIFPGAARAQFSIARLLESQNNMIAAVEAYRVLLNNWPDDPVWTDLAQSRVIILSE